MGAPARSASPAAGERGCPCPCGALHCPCPCGALHCPCPCGALHCPCPCGALHCPCPCAPALVAHSVSPALVPLPLWRTPLPLPLWRTPLLACSRQAGVAGDVHARPQSLIPSSLLPTPRGGPAGMSPEVWPCAHAAAPPGVLTQPPHLACSCSRPTWRAHAAAPPGVRHTLNPPLNHPERSPPHCGAPSAVGTGPPHV